jgi:hypothetical protein
MSWRRPVGLVAHALSNVAASIKIKTDLRMDPSQDRTEKRRDACDLPGLFARPRLEQKHIRLLPPAP